MRRRWRKRRHDRLVKRVVCGKDRAAVCLTGGSSPQGLYRLLAEDPWRGEVPWDRVHWFIGDDRFVPETDPLSNMGMARRLFLDRSARRGKTSIRSRRMRTIPKARRGSTKTSSKRFTAPIASIGPAVV